METLVRKSRSIPPRNAPRPRPPAKETPHETPPPNADGRPHAPSSTATTFERGTRFSVNPLCFFRGSLEASRSVAKRREASRSVAKRREASLFRDLFGAKLSFFFFFFRGEAKLFLLLFSKKHRKRPSKGCFLRGAFSSSFFEKTKASPLLKKMCFLRGAKLSFFFFPQRGFPFFDKIAFQKKKDLVSESQKSVDPITNLDHRPSLQKVANIPITFRR